MWQRGISRDEELPDDLAQRWQQWCMELLQLHQIHLFPDGMELKNCKMNKAKFFMCSAMQVRRPRAQQRISKDSQLIEKL